MATLIAVVVVAAAGMGVFPAHTDTHTRKPAKENCKFFLCLLRQLL